MPGSDLAGQMSGFEIVAPAWPSDVICRIMSTALVIAFCADLLLVVFDVLRQIVVDGGMIARCD